jgi:carboxymethylenebutenolidase
MCYGTDARPPLPPIAGGAGAMRSEDVILEASDGNRFLAFTAVAAASGAPGIVILPDVRGLHAFYRELAVRFAEAGVHATAMDYFGRTAGMGAREGDFDYMSHVQQTAPETVAQDVAAAVAHVRSPDGGEATAIYTVGFCFGGRHSFNQAAGGHGLSGVIGFYGVPQQRDADDAYAPMLQVGRYECPVLGLFGGSDKAIPLESVERFRHALDQADVPSEIVVYDGAPHSFFDRTSDQHRDASDDAWRRVLRFVGSSLS